MAPRAALENRRRFTALWQTGILCGRGGGSRLRLACAASEKAAWRALAWLRRRQRARRRRQRRRRPQGALFPAPSPPVPHTPLTAAPDRPVASPAVAAAVTPLPLPDPLGPPHDARATALAAAAAALASAISQPLSERAAYAAAWREVAAELARRAAAASPSSSGAQPAKRGRPAQQQPQPLPKRARRADADAQADAAGLRRSKRRAPVEVVVIDDSSDDDDKKKQHQTQSGPSPSPPPSSSSPPPLISAHDLKTLKPRNWLNDECINAYFALIQKRQQQRQQQQQQQKRRQANSGGAAAVSSPPLRVFCFSSFFFTLLTSSGGLDGRYDFDAVRRWTMRACFSEDDGSDGDDENDARQQATPLLARCHLILAPVHLSGAHWALATVWPSLGRAEVFDSLAGPSSASALGVARVFAGWLEDEARDKGVRLPAKVRARAGRAPQQRDSHSCGALVCAMAERVAAGLQASGLEAALGCGGGGGGNGVGVAGPAAARLRLGLAREIVKGRLEGEEDD